MHNDRTINYLCYQIIIITIIPQLGQMPEKKPSQNKKTVSTHRLKNKSVSSKTLNVRSKKTSLFQSMDELPFKNKHIKKHLTEKSQKSLSGGQSSTRIHEDRRPNGEYYGSDTSIFTHRQHKSTELRCLKQSNSQHKKEQTEVILTKLLQSYRKLQFKHRQQLKEMGQGLSPTEMRRLKKVQEYELKQIMQSIVEIEESIWCH